MLLGICVFSFVVDISDIHASNDVFAVEGTWPQLFSWCRPYPHPAATAICYGTLTCKTVVRTYIIIPYSGFYLRGTYKICEASQACKFTF